MAEETATSRYVRLNKIHDAPMEEIRPGELNQPIRVPQVSLNWSKMFLICILFHSPDIKTISCICFVFLIINLVIRLQNSPCDPCMVHCCMHWCAICQEHREMRGHLSDTLETQPSVIHPPPTQEMAANDGHDSGVSANQHTV
ncbi:hypothetical protein B296_00053086 [Ensete ventricosum]|uniref:Uncharacterized protein n=1 Tax=Ensete ventricosum TaxID=4639 RepID=A0A426Y9S2_ENSVE|nr:hypothetical protein B296_00053086 [Ensete ventricosum]